jgi:DNA-binding ferritin-like protein (Dps family)
MVHEVYVLDLLESSGEEKELRLEECEVKYFHPRSDNSEKFSTIYSGGTDRINYDTATAMTKARFEAGDAKVELNSSWLGVSRDAMVRAGELEEKAGHNPVERKYSSMGDQAYVNEEARFFVVEGEKSIFGDMLNEKLFDLDSGDEVETPELLHDQLYRVLEKAVFMAEGREVEIISGEEIDTFMNSIFDVKESVDFERDYYEELEKSMDRLSGLIVEDLKIIEMEEKKEVAG